MSRRKDNLTTQFRASHNLTFSFSVQNLFDATASIDAVTYAGSLRRIILRFTKME